MPGSPAPHAEDDTSLEQVGDQPATRRLLALGAAVLVGLGAGAAGGALAAFVTFWLLILGSFFGGPRPSPSAWTWEGLLFAQVYLVYFLILGAKIGAVLGLPLGAVGALVAWLVGCPPSSRARSVFVLGVGMVGAVAMGIFEFQYLATGGVWMTLSFTLGGLIGGVVGAKLWLRLWAATCSGEVPEPA